MDIVIRGVCSNSGFGVALKGLIKTSIAAGYNTKFMPVNAHLLQHRKGFVEKDLQWIDSISVDEKYDCSESILIDVGSLVYGMTIPMVLCKKKILYATYETVKIHPNYVAFMNKKYDEIWTASNFNKISWLSSGVTKHIKIIPHYLDFEYFTEDVKPMLISNRKGFNFIYVADMTFRKGLHLLLPAFTTEFKPEEDVSLTLKLMMSSPDKDVAPKIIEALNRILFMCDMIDKPRPTILVLIENLSYNKLANFYKSGDCYVAPYHAEGFCMPIAEAMSCRLPIIATRCSAPVDYLNTDNSLMIELDEKRPTIPILDQWQLVVDPQYEGQSLYNPSFDSLKTKLRYAFEHKDEMKTKGIQANKDIREYCRLDRLAEIFKQLIEE